MSIYSRFAIILFANVSSCLANMLGQFLTSFALYWFKDWGMYIVYCTYSHPGLKEPGMYVIKKYEPQND